MHIVNYNVPKLSSSGFKLNVILLDGLSTKAIGSSLLYYLFIIGRTRKMGSYLYEGYLHV